MIPVLFFFPLTKICEFSSSLLLSLFQKVLLSVFFFFYSQLFILFTKIVILFKFIVPLIFQWKIHCNRECWWPCSCYMEFFRIMYTFLNLLFSMFFILELFSFPFLMTYMDLFLDYRLWNLSFPYYLRFSYPINGKKNLPISLLDSLWSFKSKCS